MKKIIIFAYLFIYTMTINAQHNLKLKFDKNGEFKIVQFTDTHVELQRNKNLSVYQTVKTVLALEKPDFVILTGDIVTGDDPQEGYKRFADIFKEAKIPWAAVWGNHDSEHNLSRKKVAEYVEKLPYCLNKNDNSITGYSNYILPVYGKKNKIEALMYCMDSNDYSTLKPLVDGYGWFDFSQINWYLKKSKEYTKENNGKPLPALAFFHIPLPEYTDAWNNKKFPPIGVRNEDECSPDINTGMFAAMLTGGDVMGTFVGHDHINDFIGVYYNIALAYGRITKIMKNPKEDPLAGGRVIVLKEGKREFDTWIRDMNGKKELFCNFPGSFQTTDENN